MKRALHKNYLSLLLLTVFSLSSLGVGQCPCDHSVGSQKTEINEQADSYCCDESKKQAESNHDLDSCCCETAKTLVSSGLKTLDLGFSLVGIIEWEKAQSFYQEKRLLVSKNSIPILLNNQVIRSVILLV